jgi:hypothetical protein
MHQWPLPADCRLAPGARPDPPDRKQQSHKEAAMSWLEIASMVLVAILAPLVAAWADLKVTELKEKEASQ